MTDKENIDLEEVCLKIKPKSKQNLPFSCFRSWLQEKRSWKASGRAGLKNWGVVWKLKDKNIATQIKVGSRLLADSKAVALSLELEAATARLLHRRREGEKMEEESARWSGDFLWQERPSLFADWRGRRGGWERRLQPLQPATRHSLVSWANTWQGEVKMVHPALLNLFRNSNFPAWTLG